jgi:hypothetical protein
MTEETISAYIQCYSNRTALYKCLNSFRRAYPSEAITLVSDYGEDFSKFADRFHLYYYYSERKADPGNLGKDGAREYLRRIYDHCLRAASDYVVILEEDVFTCRRIAQPPSSDCGGPRLIPLSDALIRHLQKINDTTHSYGYAMCGGSIFDRAAFIKCYEKQNLDFGLLEILDDRTIKYGDVLLTVLFLLNGYTYAVWNEVSEIKHPWKHMRIYRNAAFDHANKTWYGAKFDDSWLEKTSIQNRRPFLSHAKAVFRDFADFKVPVTELRLRTSLHSLRALLRTWASGRGSRVS